MLTFPLKGQYKQQKVFDVINNWNTTMVGMEKLEKALMAKSKLKNKELGNIWYKTSKVLLGAGKFYASEQDYINGKPFDPTKNEPIKLDVKNIEFLWKDSDSIHFLEKV